MKFYFKKLFAGILSALLIAAPFAEAANSNGRAVLIGRVNPYAGSTTQRSFTVMDVKASTGEYTSPQRPAPNEDNRTQLIIRNVGSTVLQFGYNTTDNTNTQYAATTWTITLNPGQEYVENGYIPSSLSTQRILSERPFTSGQGGRYTVWKEIAGAVQSGVPVIRAITPLPVSPLALNVLDFQTTINISGLSKDRSTVYGTDGGVNLYQNTHDGDPAFWTLVHTFTGVPSGVLTSVIETGDGEIIAFFGLVTGTIYKSTGWAASHTSATWAQVIASATGGAFRAQWGGGTFSSQSGAVNVIAEYGKYWSTQPTPDPTATTHIYASRTSGTNWTLLLDLQTMFPTTNSLSTYGAAYDPDWDCMVGAYGNSGPNGNNFTEILYSCDWRTIFTGGTATWTSIPIPPLWIGNTNHWQSVALSTTQNSWRLGSEGDSGVYIFPKIAYRQLGAGFIQNVISGRAGSHLLPGSFNRAAANQRYMFGTGNAGSGPDVGAQLYFDQLDAGKTLQEVYRNDVYKVSNYGVYQPYGPTLNGVFLVSLGAPTGTGVGVWTTLRANLVSPPVGTYDQSANLTGNGATTAFTFPHFLSYTPTTLNAYPQNAASIAIAAPTVTADGTNITLTFSVAPTNATAYSYALRYQ